jgi:hypothetical protein
MAFKLVEIEFVGGPFDGEIHPFCEPLIPLLGIPVLNTGEIPFRSEPPIDAWSTASAFYEFERSEGALRYRFVRITNTPTEIDRSDPAIQKALEAGWRAVRQSQKPNEH